MTLRDDALAAYQAWKAQQDADEAAYQRERGDKLQTLLARQFGADPEKMLVDLEGLVTVTVDGLRFRYLGNVSDTFGLVGVCPRCGAEATSRRIFYKREIGEQLVCFQPGGEHWCEPETVMDTPAERLVAALQECLNLGGEV